MRCRGERHLPSLATPVAGGGVIGSRTALMPSTERLASGRIRLLDAHLWVAETHYLDLIASLHIHG